VNAPQRIARVRRTYNQWVANQTLEDYALRFTAKTARKWSGFRVANTALGAISFLALEAIGGTITISYGFDNAVVAIVVVGVIIFATGLPISYYACKYGVDIDLLTRGAGFGYIGSTITSLIYASFTFLFFAIEAAIMALALELCFSIPLWLGYLVSSVVVIPLVTHGITWISRLQLWTQPIWIVLHLLPFVFIAARAPDAGAEWRNFAGTSPNAQGGFHILQFGAAATVVFSLVAQIGEQVDFLRFLPHARARSISWWLALISAGPGWIVPGTLKLLAGSFLAALAVHHLVPPDKAAEPTQMYLVAFSYVFSSPQLALAATGAFVILSQVKINVTNAYAGSLAWSNFFSRLTHSHPGRVVWLVFNVVIALVLMELGIFRALEHILGLYSIVAIAWVGALVADLVVNKPLGLSPSYVEFKRAHLYDINPVGVGAMALACATGIASYGGLLGILSQALSPFVTLATAFIAAPLIAGVTRGRFYIARPALNHWHGESTIRCCICEHSFEPEDMALCPAYSGPICSLCCSLDARCHDRCKEDARFADQILAGLKSTLPQWAVIPLTSRLAHYLGVLSVFALVIGAALSLVYLQSTYGGHSPRESVSSTLWTVFFVLALIAGVAAWLFVLAQESRLVAEEESSRQTILLMQEIEAHQRTDAMLQKAKETAEAASKAKSRQVVGLSHELRTPLNAILGYAQLLERDPALPPRRVDAIKVVRRSAEHLSGMIDGLLDISKIEAGRFTLDRNEVRFLDFLEQIADMFRMQAAAKGIAFYFTPAGRMPLAVYSDESRLRQILLNLLSNAVKFTHEGSVAIGVRYQSQTATFEIEDTGVGIRPEDLDRIFEPFERIESVETDGPSGTGLGLTITRRLVETMGGDISVTSEHGKGSTFRVRLFMAEVARPRSALPSERRIVGYAGRRRTILVADDNDVHRALIGNILTPLGFTTLSAPDGAAALRTIDGSTVDLLLLDVLMPGMNGWDVARDLRQQGHSDLSIIMLSANLSEANRVLTPERAHDDLLLKPIDIRLLLDKIGSALKLEWLDAEADTPAIPADAFDPAARPARAEIAELRQLGEIGYVRGIQAKLDTIEKADQRHRPFVAQMRELVGAYDLKQYLLVLREAERHDA
jgi:signal transduction histidine kinase/ActR/RegA family two-component response regulator